MKHILFAWELGAGFGHIAKTMMVAQTLAKQGHSISFALQNMTHAPLLNGKGFRCVQIPRNGPSRQWRKPFNYSGLLLNNGFDSPGSLRPTIVEWQKLFSEMQPDLLICDHAPSAILASHVAAIPAALMGGGFFCPPVESPYPNMIPWEHRSDAALGVADDEITKVIHETLDGIPGTPLIKSVHDVFDAAPRFVCTFEELDHYHCQREIYYGGLFENVGEIKPEWPKRYPRKIFMYITGHPSFIAKLLRALAKIPADVLAVLRGIPDDAIPKDLPAHIKILHSPVNAVLALAECDLVINHASLGIVSASMVTGTPMLLAPVFLEQALLCRRVIETGAAQQIESDAPEKHFTQRIAELLSDSRYKEAAMRFAGKYAGYRPADTAEKIAEHALRLIA